MNHRVRFWKMIGTVSASVLVMAMSLFAEKPVDRSTTDGISRSIDTSALERPWPREWVKIFEAGRSEVRWRQQVSRKNGVFAGARFHAPLAREQVWQLSTDMTDIGRMTPGVTAVRFLEQTPHRQVIQVDVKVLWKTLRLTFEIEQDPPRVMRFRLVNQTVGEYRGVCQFQDTPSPEGFPGQETGTTVELATWLKPARPIPLGLLALVERMTILNGIRNFLASCDAHRNRALDSIHRSNPSLEIRGSVDTPQSLC